MKLRSKILLPVGIVLVALIAGIYHVSTSILLQGFAHVEENAMRVNITRSVNALHEAVNELVSKSSDWSMWDDACEFVDNHNKEFIQSNVSPLALRNIHVDGMLLCDSQGRIALDVMLRRGDADLLEPDKLTPLLHSYPHLAEFKDNSSLHSGLLLTACGPMMVVSRPILNSQGTGDIKGTLLFVRKVGDGLLESMEKQTQLRTAICRIGDISMPGDFSDALALLSPDHPVLVRPVTDNLITAYTIIPDISGKPLLMLRTSSPRHEFQWGHTTIHYLLLSLIAVACVSAVVVVVLIEKVILRRLALLARQVTDIGKAADVKARVSIAGSDELSVLGVQVNHMLDSLHRAQREREELAKQLVETSRQAGMAEVATGILHNVGNVLNSVNVSTNMLADKLRVSKVHNLGKAIDLIRTNQDRLGDFLVADEKGRALPAYLIRLSEFLSHEHEAMLGEIQTLGKSIDHIKQIVAAQQSYARVTTAASHFDLTAAVEDALNLNSHRLVKSHILIERQFSLVKPVYADRHLVIQILINLIANAENAMRDVPETSRTLRICVTESQREGKSFALVSIADSGCGIPEETITRIFQYGFTTRNDGHGFGLHASANAARQMHGLLSARSEGKGKGAVFTLELPLQPAEVSK